MDEKSQNTGNPENPGAPEDPSTPSPEPDAAQASPEASPLTSEASPTAAQPVAEPKAPFRDRVLGMRGVAAVAVASVILGGAGGAALGAATAGDDRDQMRGPGMINGQFPGGPGGQFDGRDQRDDRQLLPPGSNQLSPTTEPEGDES